MANQTTQGQPAYPGAPDEAPPQKWQPGKVMDNQSTPSAAGPASSDAPKFESYGNVGSNFSPVAPPPSSSRPSGQAPKVEFNKEGELTEEQCREAMLEYVSSNCCYGSKPAQNHEIKKIIPSTALHYTLESFCEVRETACIAQPFRGQPIDGRDNGTPPAPWAVSCQPDGIFRDHSKSIVVPHTSQVKPCHVCNSAGHKRCVFCKGEGKCRCEGCGSKGKVLRRNNQGRRYYEICLICAGSGLRRCYTCSGEGHLTCSACDGYCRLHLFIQLKVTYKTHKEDFILQETQMPDELMKKVSGTKTFEQTLPQVLPIKDHPVPAMAEASVRLCDSHRKNWPNERIVHQRQSLVAIPVTEVEAKWENWESRYWVYGKEHQVYCTDYPHTRCWGCVIM